MAIPEKPVAILRVVKTPSGNWTWRTVHKTWATIVRRKTRSIFSSFASMAPTFEMTMRTQGVKLENCIRWEKEMYFINTVDSERHLVKVAVAALKSVTVMRSIERYGRNTLNNPIRLEPEKIRFPAWLAEKYVRTSVDVPAMPIETRYVLIVPKVIPEIPAGDIIHFDGRSFAVEVAHTLEADRNEYEIVERRDA